MVWNYYTKEDNKKFVGDEWTTISADVSWYCQIMYLAGKRRKTHQGFQSVSVLRIHHLSPDISSSLAQSQINIKKNEWYHPKASPCLTSARRYSLHQGRDDITLKIHILTRIPLHFRSKIIWRRSFHYKFWQLKPLLICKYWAKGLW